MQAFKQISYILKKLTSVQRLLIELVEPGVLSNAYKIITACNYTSLLQYAFIIYLEVRLRESTNITIWKFHQNSMITVYYEY